MSKLTDVFGGFKALPLVIVLFVQWIGIEARRNVTIVTYADHGVESFYSYVNSVNTVYCERFGHNSLLFPAVTSAVFPNLILGREKDPRWEKVAVMLSIFESLFDADDGRSSQNESLSLLLHQTEYFVWMDADMMIVNLETDFLSEVISDHPLEDLLISAEYHSETGVANTGAFIMRKTTWNLDFLRLWWAQDHTRGHDQNLFDAVYRDLHRQEGEHLDRHIRILSPTVLNSQPPAHLTLSPSDNVLHLMGEREDFRVCTFSKGESLLKLQRQHLSDQSTDIAPDASCFSSHERHEEPDNVDVEENEYLSVHLVKLGLNRSFLVHCLESVILSRTPSLAASMHTDINALVSMVLPSPMYGDHVQVALQRLLSAFEEFRELHLQSIQLQAASKDQHAVLLRIKRLRGLYQDWTSLMHYVDSPHSVAIPIKQQVDLLNTLGLLGNDYLQDLTQYFFSPHSAKDFSMGNAHEVDSRSATISIQVDIDRMYDEVDGYLQRLCRLVHSSSLSLVQEMRAMLWQNRASYYLRLTMLPLSLLPREMDWRALALRNLHQALQAYHVPSPGQSFQQDFDDLPAWQDAPTSGIYNKAMNRYQYVRILSDLADVYCLPGVHAVTRLTDDVARAMQLYAKAAELWEDLLLLHLPVSSYSTKFAGREDERLDFEARWQNDHMHYLSVLRHACNCLASSTTLPPSPSHVDSTPIQSEVKKSPSSSIELKSASHSSREKETSHESLVKWWATKYRNLQMMFPTHVPDHPMCSISWPSVDIEANPAMTNERKASGAQKKMFRRKKTAP